MIDIEELELEFNAFYGDKENEHTLLARMHPLIEQVRVLTKTLELIGKHMPFDPWLHTLIKEVIGYEKVIE